MPNFTKVQDRDFYTILAGLRRYRLEQDFTYRELAERIGLAHSKVFRLLNDSKPRINERTRYRVVKFAHQMGISLERRVS